MKKNFLLFVFVILAIFALLGIAFMFLAEKGSLYDFQKQYVVLSGAFLIIIGFLLHLIRLMGQADQIK